MKRNEFAKLCKGINDARMKLMFKKGDDYATDEDELSNFKRMRALCHILKIAPRRSARDCAMFLAMLKLDRLQNLYNREVAPKNESVVDTVVDLHNYLDLAYGCGLDKPLT